jgi:hypothetical protein
MGHGREGRLGAAARQLLLKAKHESTCRKMARLTTAERMRIFQIVSIDAYERAGPAKKRALGRRKWPREGLAAVGSAWEEWWRITLSVF